MAEEASQETVGALRAEEERKAGAEREEAEAEAEEEKHGKGKEGEEAELVGEIRTGEQTQWRAEIIRDGGEQERAVETTEHDEHGTKGESEGQEHASEAPQTEEAFLSAADGRAHASEAAAPESKGSQQEGVVPQTEADVMLAVVDKENSEEQAADESEAEPRVESPPPPSSQAEADASETSRADQPSSAHAVNGVGTQAAKDDVTSTSAQASAPSHMQPSQQPKHKHKKKKKERIQPENGSSPQEQAQRYLEENKVGELIENMTAQLVFHRPGDPRTFLIDYVDKLQELAEHFDDPKEEPPVLFDESNAKAVFRTYDPSNRGWISMSQYHQAMKNLFFKEYNDEPKGFVEGRITMDTFVEECTDASKNTAMTFKI